MSVLQGNYEKDCQSLEKMMVGDGTLKKRELSVSGKRASVYYCDGLASGEKVALEIIRPLLGFTAPRVSAVLLSSCGIFSGEASLCLTADELCSALMEGDAAVIVEDSARALILGAKGFPQRGVSEPESEKVIKGPREGFSESLISNLALLRRRLRTTCLRHEFFSVGSVTNTRACLCYIEGIADEKTVAEMRKRLKKVDFDSDMGANVITEQVRDFPGSVFQTLGSTERPDVVSAKLLEGRVAVFCDGSPTVITAPHILLEEMQVAEEYYVSAPFASVSRFLKVVGLFLSVSTAPLYIAAVSFHPEVLPTALLFSVSSARQGVPFPLVLETVILIAVFDILRETGIRTVSSVGQTLSIVGALVLGQAAVEARFVSAPTVIVVAFTGVTGLMISKMQGAVIFLRLGLIILTSCIGIYGYVFGMTLIAWRLVTLSSFGVPYLGGGGAAEDSLVRLPYNLMKKRYRFLSGRKK